jgi:hypothetical protein
VEFKYHAMAFEGPGKFFAGKDASLDHDERLRLHETVLSGTPTTAASSTLP